ncbi:S-layer homology domain-containing protein [Chakrabartyella piscis]|uniref:S-layer homology domain-containing protein n=1 Tax=Chakrabartyella piscis TaxID=2918914 RepID=UPI002958C65B|nr:S-layer homology domain-containing protein [Chakrabartyella piscis]
MTPEHKGLFGDDLVVDLIITSDGKVISSFGEYEIKVTMPYEPRDGESPENIVVWYVWESGEITALEITYDVTTETVSFVAAHFSVYTVNHVESITFENVSANAYHYNGVLWAVDPDITSGTSATTFGPDDDCTRGQVVTFLYRNSSN